MDVLEQDARSLPRGDEKPLWRFPSFQFMVPTQFLGAFNDNLFKQMVLLVAVQLTKEGGGGSYQAMATAVFAFPFILFSGLAGSLADRFSKTRIIFLAKVAEVIIMALGAISFWLGGISPALLMPLLLATLFLMATQSAFFGPAKYGILPEMLPQRHLPRANGVLLMTTFLAIILGQAPAGWLRDSFEAKYVPSLLCVLLALVGTTTALGIRRLPPARPDLVVSRHPFGDLWPTLRKIFADKPLTLVILANSYFWFLGAICQMLVNRYGLKLMGLGQTRASLLLFPLSVGLAAGSVLGGFLSRGNLDFRPVRWGIAVTTGSLLLLGFAHVHEVAAHASLFLLGTGGGLFGLPLQSFVQYRPSAGEKGRVVAASNFVNWVFIILAAAYFYGATEVTPTEWVPINLAILTALVGVVVLPKLKALETAATASGKAP